MFWWTPCMYTLNHLALKRSQIQSSLENTVYFVVYSSVPRGGVRATSFSRPSNMLHTFSSEPPQNVCPSIFLI